MNFSLNAKVKNMANIIQEIEKARMSRTVPDFNPGDTVVVQGQTGSDGTIAATTIRSGGFGPGGFGGAGGGPGGAPAATTPTT